MKKILIAFFSGIILSCNMTDKKNQDAVYNPQELYTDLFHEVQVKEIFDDVKTFSDCIPLKDPKQIKALYDKEKDKPDFNLKSFVLKHFKVISDLELKADNENSGRPFKENINSLWDELTRNPDSLIANNSLIPLPKPYIVPGGRFKEIYYWDSYFTMVGLAASGKLDMVEHMLDNFSYLIDKFGFIPNGNRSYYLSRSQPPFFSSMVMLYAQYEGLEKAVKYLPQLEKEYNYWMDGQDKVNLKNKAYKKVVWLDGNVILNRYQDVLTAIRPEGYLTDVEVLKKVSSDKKDEVMAHRRATCESGWDFSSRWLKDANEGIENMITSDILPIDLNCLLFHLEKTISELSNHQGNLEKEQKYHLLALRRQEAINRYFWNTESECYVDYNFKLQSSSLQVTLASNFPLYYKIAGDYQARCQERLMREHFLHSGGLVTTLFESGEQWDYPNGWAPLQWISIKGLEHYKHSDLANTVTNRWLHLNKKVFSQTGKMMEKYNVVDTTLVAGGGEYETVDGFGSTNGVAMALLEKVTKY